MVNARNNSNANRNSGPNLVLFLFELQVATRMFHWQAAALAEHEAAGKLVGKIIDLTDSIIERYMGIYGRVRMPAGATIPVPNVSKDDMMTRLVTGIEYLDKRMPRDSHIRALRDELTGAMAQTLYLLTFS